MGSSSDDSILDFPQTIPIKIFGENTPRFRDAALGIVRAHYENLLDEHVSERASRGDRYLSLTVTVRAESRDQIDAVYRELSASGDVLMAL